MNPIIRLRRSIMSMDEPIDIINNYGEITDYELFTKECIIISEVKMGLHGSTYDIRFYVGRASYLRRCVIEYEFYNSEKMTSIHLHKSQVKCFKQGYFDYNSVPYRPAIKILFNNVVAHMCKKTCKKRAKIIKN